MGALQVVEVEAAVELVRPAEPLCTEADAVGIAHDNLLGVGEDVKEDTDERCERKADNQRVSLQEARGCGTFHGDSIAIKDDARAANSRNSGSETG